MKNVTSTKLISAKAELLEAADMMKISIKETKSLTKFGEARDKFLEEFERIIHKLIWG